MEDSAAVGGVFIAASALGLVHLTGNAIYDAIGSISIGGMYLLLYCGWSREWEAYLYWWYQWTNIQMLCVFIL